MWYKIREPNPNYPIRNPKWTKDGVPVDVARVNAAHTPEGLNVGYTFFESDEEMAAAWGLVAVVKEITNE